MPWRWPGPRGEGFVAIQVVLFGVIAFAPPSALPVTLGQALKVLSGPLLAWGLLLSPLGLLALGRSLSIFPKPKPDGRLVQSGAYHWVRHPIYSGVLGLSFGWAFWRGALWGLVASGALFVLFNRKARLEEQWLAERFPDYRGYMARSKRLLPWIY